MKGRTDLTYRIHYEQDHVNDLCPTNDGSNQTGVTWAIDQSDLKLLLVGKVFLQVFG